MVKAIVTGKSWEHSDEIEADVPVFFNPMPKGEGYNLLEIVNHKANVINKCEVTDYYEDDIEQKNMLVIMCPKTKIHLVKEGQTAI